MRMSQGYIRGKGSTFPYHARRFISQQQVNLRASVVKKKLEMSSNTSYIASACTVYCEGPLLQSIQLSGIFNDSKTFVDMPMIYNPQETLAAFNTIPDTNNKTALEIFLKDYFLPAKSDLDDWIPTDYTTTPNILSRITDPDYYFWTSDLNALWLVLGRQVNESVHENPQRHSFVPRNYPMIVPGGRFRESYYWDSWWIIRGLLVCDMYDTALNVISNLLDDIDNFGFVPNGGRIYYIDRSQPPVLSEMILDYYYYMEDKFGLTSSIESFMISAYGSLQTEYAWWMNATNGHTVLMDNGAVLNRYYSNYTTPRPESYEADYQNTSLPGITERYAQFYYHNKRAGAESGWDYSSRWIRGQYNISGVATSEILPVELNSILYRFELNLNTIGGIVNAFAARRRRLASGGSSRGLRNTAGQSNVALAATTDQYPAWQNYTAAAAARYSAIQEYLWDEVAYHWWDYNTTAGAFNKLGDPLGASVSIASWIPLWAGILPNSTTDNHTVIANKLVASLESSQLVQIAGVLTTTLSTGQQWDSPNAWPPLVWFTIQGLNNLATTESFNLAQTISTRWLNTCYIAYNTTQYMYEKYNAFEVGVGGGGGEYKPQIGFGWSNAVALILLNEKYPPIPTADDNGNGGSSGDSLPGWAVALIVILVVASVAVVGYLAYGRLRGGGGKNEMRKSDNRSLSMNSHTSDTNNSSGGGVANPISNKE